MFHSFELYLDLVNHLISNDIKTSQILYCKFPPCDIEQFSQFLQPNINIIESQINNKINIYNINETLNTNGINIFILYEKFMPFFDIKYLINCKSDNVLSIKQNDDLNIENLSKLLISFGYERVFNVYEKFTFAIRGDILDIGILDESYGIRVNFNNTKIEKINHFEYDTQISLNKIFVSINIYKLIV